MGKRLTLALAALGIVVGLAACGGSSGNGAGTTSTSSAPGY